MTAEESFKPPRKKHNILWWLGGIFLLLLGIFFFQLFGPNRPIIVSRQTTRITEPLGPDGLPDYERYVLDLYRDGVTPQNNAASLLWPALWPGELDPPQYAAVAKELGLTKIPLKKDALEPLYSKTNQEVIAGWMLNLNASQEPQFKANPPSDELVFELIDRAMSRPWTSEQVPPLARWATKNKKPLDMLVEGSRRPRCYFPSPSLIDGERDTLIAMMLPGVQGVREAGRSLLARAMWHVGEGRLEEAWQDVLAVHRIGRLTAQGKTLVEHLVGIAISGMACDATATMLHHGNPTADVVRQIQRDLASLPEFSVMADSIDHMERMSYLDVFAHFDKMDREDLSMLQFGDQAAYINVVSVDWNVVLRKGNEFYDRLVAAARQPTRAARVKAISQIETDLLRLDKDLHSPAALIGAVISPSRRSDAVAAVMLNLFLPATGAAMNAQDRANNQLMLTRLAAALALYRAEHGAYPENLEDVVPGAIEKLPVDIYNAQPFLYQRDGEGYLLYCAGENGADDGGSNSQSTILLGQPLDQLEVAEAQKLESQIPAGADDISIRVPRLPFKISAAPAQTGEP